MRHTKLKIAAISSFSALVVMAMPALASANTAATTISSVVGAGINLLTTSGTVSIDATPNGPGVQTIASDTVTVSTNATAGYTLKLNETTAETALKSGSNSIPATSGSFASPAAMAVNTWGYRVDGIGTFSAGTTTGASNAAISGAITFAKVPISATPDTLKTTATTATNDTTTVWYAVAVNTSTPSGTYTNSVTYTATTN